MTKLNMTKRDEWYTPKYILEALGGCFDFDPATTSANAKRLDIKDYHTIETDGLANDWKGFRVWMNPPFTLKKEFIAKAIEQLKLRNVFEVFILLPCETLTTKYFTSLMDDMQIRSDIFIPNRRIPFINENGELVNGVMFGSVVIKLTRSNSNGQMNYFNIDGVTNE